jgi:hypothetical protein
MDKRRRAIRLGLRITLLVSFVVIVSVIGSMATAIAGALTDAGGGTPLLHSLVINSVAALIATVGVVLHTKFVRTW